MSNIRGRIESIAESMGHKIMLLDDLDEALIGMTESIEPVAVYSSDKIIEILQSRDGMDQDEAIEFYEYNIVNLIGSEGSPILVQGILML